MLQLRLHFGERDRCGDGPLDAAVMDACVRHGVRAAALLRGVEGFGAKHRLRTDRLLSLSEDAPLVAVAVGEMDVVEALAEEIRGMAVEGLVVLEEVEALDSEAVGDRGAPVAGAPEDEGGGDVVKVTIWGPRSGSASPHLGAVAALHRHGAMAATVLLGVDGVLDGTRRRARFVAANGGVPAMTVAAGERAKIDAALAELDGASLVTVEAVATYRRIATVSRHSAGAVERKSVIDRASHRTDGAGPAAGAATRVTLMTSEIAGCQSHPLYVELIHRLRQEGAAGATALRGVWGFRGGGEPHGDRVLALRRDVPLLVETIDTPERTARWRELALALAGDQDLVYSQVIPRTLTLD
jgi:PII-like signaling protein